MIWNDLLRYFTPTYSALTVITFLDFACFHVMYDCTFKNWFLSWAFKPKNFEWTFTLFHILLQLLRALKKWAQFNTFKQNLFQKNSADFLLRIFFVKWVCWFWRLPCHFWLREMKKSKFLNPKSISCMDSNVVLYQSQIWLEPFPKANKSLLCNCIFTKNLINIVILKFKKYVVKIKMQKNPMLF